MQSKSEQDDGAERRESIRTPLKLKIKVIHHKLGELTLYTANLSDTGVYILSEGQLVPPIGDVVKVQIQDLPQAAPLVDAEVVRVSQNGMGLRFVAVAD